MLKTLIRILARIENGIEHLFGKTMEDTCMYIHDMQCFETRVKHGEALFFAWIPDLCTFQLNLV